MKKTRIISVALLLAVLLCGRSYAQQFVSVEESLKKNVEYLADPARLGRGAGSQGEADAAKYLYKQLVDAGVTMLTGENGEDFSFAHKGDTIYSRNIIGVVEGINPALKDEYVVIAAHYDHLGTSVLKRDGADEVQIYYGADDNASGVATLIEIAKEVALQPHLFDRSIIFALFGAEEYGMVGSWYFLNRSFKEVDKIVAMINLDMVGRSGRDNRIQVYTADANVELMEIVNTLSGRALSIAPSFTPTDYFPSDHRLFYEKGIPVALFTSGVHRDYHTVRDTPDKLDYTQMAQLAEYVFAMAEVISNRPDRIKAASRHDQADANAGKEKVYTQTTVDKPATFLHGTQQQFLDRWVYEYIKYPESAVKNGIQGRVIVEFVVDKKGKVTDVQIVKGLDEEIDANVIKVISASPKWKPAKIRGREVSVRISVPIEFKLTKSSTFRLKK